jgi:hypothetical protein
MMQSSAVQTLYYTNERGLEVEDVADSLLAFKAIIERVPQVLGALYPTLSVQSVSVTVESVSTGSLLEDLLVKIIWGNQEELDKAAEELGTTFKIRELLQNKKFIATLVFALVLAAGDYALKKSGASEEQRQVIQGNQNNVVIIASQLSGISAPAIEQAISTSVERAPGIAREATRLVNPAKREEGASIAAGRGSDVVISPEAVRAMPAPQQVDEDLDSVEDMSNVEIQIRATDLDSNKRGWAAIVPVLGDRRIKVNLDVGVSPAKLLAKTAVRADVTVVFRREPSGDKCPILVYIRRVRR